jgi:hypothetical protein
LRANNLLFSPVILVKQGPKKESDTWIDGKGIKWSIKNGNKIRINEQADSIRDLCKRKCSDCGFDISMLGNNLDQKTHTKIRANALNVIKKMK